MKALLTTPLLIIAFFVSFTNGYSQESQSDRLKSDLVEIIGGKYYVDDFALLKVNGETFQIELMAEAPVEVISRDNFVSYYSTYGMLTIVTMFQAAGLTIADIDIEDLDELIGDPDIVVKFIMAKNGVQLQLTSNGEVNRVTMTWDEFLGD